MYASRHHSSQQSTNDTKQRIVCLHAYVYPNCNLHEKGGGGGGTLP